MAWMAECSGFEVLRRFCERNGFTQADVARAVGVAPPVVHDWFVEAKRPGKLFQQALDRWSNGAIGQGVWMTEAERSRVAAVKPFEKATKRRARKPSSSAA